MIIRDAVWSPTDDEQAQNRLLRKGLSEKSQCARKVCTIRPAPFYNTSTQQYYCGGCSRKINDAAGQELCKKE